MRLSADDDTPRELPPFTGSNHPRVKVAREWRGAVVTVATIVAFVVLAVVQEWPAELSCGAIGAASGVWFWRGQKTAS